MSTVSENTSIIGDVTGGTGYASYTPGEVTLNAPGVLSTGSNGGASAAIVGPGGQYSSGASGSSSSGTSYYDVDTSLNDVYKQAQAAGISVNKPSTYGQTITNQAQAQKVIDDYVAKVNAAIKPTYDISSNLAEVNNTLKDYNLSVSAPAKTTYSDQASAQAALDSYISSAQAALDNWTKSQPVKVYDDLGREQNVSYSQYQQMDAASKNQTWRENYTVLPEEVANSRANWWINSNGLYEWEPVTAGDKAALAEENKRRARFGQAAKTTLTAGASPSTAYSTEWYSTGGNRTQASVGSGNAKLAQLRASSSINASSSAKSNTAQTAKATLVSSPSTTSKTASTAEGKAYQASTQQKAQAIASALASNKTAQEQIAANKSTVQSTPKIISSTVSDAQKTAELTGTTASKSDFTTGNSALATYNRTQQSAAATSAAAATTTAAATGSTGKVISVNNTKTTPGTGTQTKSTAELLAINSKTETSNKATVVSKSTAAEIAASIGGAAASTVATSVAASTAKSATATPTSYVQGTGNKLTTYAATAELVSELNKQYAQVKAAGYDTGVLSTAEKSSTINPNYKAALEAQKAEAAKQEQLRQAVIANPLLDAAGNAINQITTSSGLAKTTLANTAKIITPIYASQASKANALSETKKDYNTLLGLGLTSSKDESTGKSILAAHEVDPTTQYYAQNAKQTAATAAQAQKEIEKSRYNSILGAGYRQQDSLTSLLSKPATEGSTKGVEAFKTVTEAAIEKAVANAKAANPSITQAELDKIADKARRSQQTSLQNLSEDVSGVASAASGVVLGAVSALKDTDSYKKVDSVVNKNLGNALVATGKLSQDVSAEGSYGKKAGAALIGLGTGDARENIKTATKTTLDTASTRGNRLITNAAVGTAEFATDVVKDDMATINKVLDAGNKYVSPYTKKVLPEDISGVIDQNILHVANRGYDYIAPKVDSAIAKSSLSDNKTLKSIRSTADTIHGISEDVEEGVEGFIKDEYKDIREKPVTYAAELGAIYAGGAVFGAALKGASLVGTGTLAKVADVAISKGGKGVWKAVDVAATKGAKLAPLATNTAVGGYMATGVAKEMKSTYEESGTAGVTKGALTLAKELAVGAKTFKTGENMLLESSSKLTKLDQKLASGKYEAYKATDLPLPRTGWAKTSVVENVGANLVTSDYRYGVSLKLGNTPLATVAKTDAGGIFGYKASMGASSMPKSVIIERVVGETPEVLTARENVVKAQTALNKLENPSLIDTITSSDIKLGEVKVEASKISRVEGSGGGTKKVQETVGKTLMVGDTPIVSVSTTGSIKIGSKPAASDAILSKNRSNFEQQSSTKEATEVGAYEATIKAKTNSTDLEYWQNFKSLNEKIESSPFIVETPKKLELTSTEVPEQMRSVTLNALKKYVAAGNKAQLEGSASTKPQLGKYMDREAKDFEFYAQDAVDATRALVSEYKAAGFKEGKDFRVKYVKNETTHATESKIEYPTKNGWKEGGSVFQHDLATAPETQSIFAGFVERKPVIIDNTPALSIPEQIHRKSDSSTFLTRHDDGSYELGARFDAALKHIADVVDMGTYAANEAGIPVSKEVVSIVKLTDKKYANYEERANGGRSTKYQAVYKEKLLGDPNYRFILENERLPTPKEINAPRAADGSIVVDKSVPKNWEPPAREFTPEQLAKFKSEMGAAKKELSSATSEESIAAREAKRKESIATAKSELAKAQADLAITEKKATDYRIFQSFSKSETPYLVKTVKEIGGEVEGRYLDAAINIADMSSKLSQPIHTPETFEITSTAIPKSAHKAVTASILDTASSGQKIRVAGSVPMKAQSTPFTTRETHDLEIYTDSVPKYLETAKSKLNTAGLKEGSDYLVTDHQIKFKGENGKMDTGIEVFDHSAPAGYTPSSSKSEIAFGHGEKAPIEVVASSERVDGDLVTRKINEQELTEQITRKVAGSTMFRGGELQPAHSGRVKDIRDTVTSATAVSNSGSVELNKAKYDKNIVDFVNASVEKYKGHKEFGKGFKEVMEDPVFSFIHKNQRVPTAAEVYKLTGEKPAVVQRTLFDSTYKPVETGNPIIDAQLNTGNTALTRKPSIIEGGSGTIGGEGKPSLLGGKGKTSLLDSITSKDRFSPLGSEGRTKASALENKAEASGFGSSGGSSERSTLFDNSGSMRTTELLSSSRKGVAARNTGLRAGVMSPGSIRSSSVHPASNMASSVIATSMRGDFTAPSSSSGVSRRGNGLSSLMSSSANRSEKSSSTSVSGGSRKPSVLSSSSPSVKSSSSPSVKSSSSPSIKSSSSPSIKSSSSPSIKSSSSPSPSMSTKITPTPASSMISSVTPKPTPQSTPGSGTSTKPSIGPSFSSIVSPSPSPSPSPSIGSVVSSVSIISPSPSSIVSPSPSSGSSSNSGSSSSGSSYLGFSRSPSPNVSTRPRIDNKKLKGNKNQLRKYGRTPRASEVKLEVKTDVATFAQTVGKGKVEAKKLLGMRNTQKMI